MDSNHRLQLANHIHLALMRELGQGIDVKQMLNSALYARDVLLVCEAYPDSELLTLGRQFRQARAEAERQAGPALGRGARNSSGFGVSKPLASESFSDFDAFIDSGHGLRQAQRRWLAPSTWFAR